MQYLFLIFLVFYGGLNIRYAFAKSEDIPSSLRFLLEQKFFDVFFFIDKKHRIPATRIILGVACLFLAAYMGYANFLV